MRRKDREITDFQDIADILCRCDTIRIGLRGGDYPYVVPVSFGFEAANGKLTVYFHGAGEGLKHALLRQDNRVCVEADLFHGYAGSGDNTTASYESVIGFGCAERCNGEEVSRGLRLLMEHAGFPDCDAEACAALPGTVVYRIPLDTVTGKRLAV